jgi:plastocyanin
MPVRHWIRSDALMRLAGPLLAGLWVWPATAADLGVILRTPAGEPVADAAVYLTPVGRPESRGATAPAVQKMLQTERQFAPRTLVVTTGTTVSFPNIDTVRHHVYSFSPAKRFELRLYAGTPPQPVTFDTPGVVVVGCNIHDWMSATIYVVNSPVHQLTDATGRAEFTGLASGNYEVTALHRRVNGPVTATVSVGAKPASTILTASLAAAAGEAASVAVTPLEERFKRFRRDAP